MKNTIKITNNFHNTSANVRFNGEDKILSVSSVKRIFNQLCGQKTCTCGGELGERGSQVVLISGLNDGRVMLEDKKKFDY